MVSWATRHLRHEEGALVIGQADADLLEQMGNPVMRNGVVAQCDSPGTLPHAHRCHGWIGSIHIRDCPSHRQARISATDTQERSISVSCGTGQPDSGLGSTEAQGCKDLQGLTRQLKVAKHGPNIWYIWYIVGIGRFHFGAVPIGQGLVQKWDAPIARTLSSSYRFGYSMG